MPIRIERDPSSGSSRRNIPGGGGSGGSGSFANLIPILLGLFGRNPKLLLIIAIIGAVWYFAGGKGCGDIASSANLSGLFNTGAQFDEKKYASTEIFEPLADNVRNPLPEKISLLEYAPPRLNQGQQGSCVAWASAYAARTIMESRESGKKPDEVTFSPSYLYNQIHLEDCQGAYLPEAMKVMQGQGLAPFRDFPYDDQDCSAAPPNYLHKKAEDFKIKGYQRLTQNDQGNKPGAVDMLAIKQNLAQGAPVVIGMMVGGSFMQEMVGKEQWIPTDQDYSMRSFGGHAMCVIGYDDYAFGDQGGFQIMNSWGDEWGKKGIAWVSYQDFDHFVKEAYGIYPGGNADAPQGKILEAELGIVLNENDSNVALEKVGNNVFRTTRKMKPREKFKLQITNSIECYVYVFGQETDGSSYVLFPYDEKHSPYCGITGTRLFPKDHSLFPDESGSEDQFAVVLSRDPLDYNALNSRISQASGRTFEEKANSVLLAEGRSEAGKTVSTTIDFARSETTAVIIKVGK